MIKKLFSIVYEISQQGFPFFLSPLFQQTITTINNFKHQQPIPVLSIDIPSGLNADTGAITHTAINADSTITFIALKKGLLTDNKNNWQVSAKGQRFLNDLLELFV